MKDSTRTENSALHVKQSSHYSDGQTLIEYALIIALVVLVLILSLPSLRQPILNVFDRYEDTLDQ